MWMNGQNILNLDFVNNLAMVNGEDYSLDRNRDSARQNAFSQYGGPITFSRGSQGTVVDSTGKITYAPHNILTYSEQFDNAGWPKTNVSVSSNFTTAPDGTTTADLLITTNTSNPNVQNSVSPNGTYAGRTVLFSFYVKANTSTEALAQLYVNGGSPTAIVPCDGGIVSGPGLIDKSSGVSNGLIRFYNLSTSVWTRVYAIGTVPSSVTSGNLTCYIKNKLSGSSVGDSICIWGAQAELVTYQTTPRAYIPTTTSVYYGPRIDYDPATLTNKGMLIEEQRTNLLLYSEQADNANWTKSRTTITANSTTAPDGTSNADKIVEDTNTNTHRIYQQVAKAASSLTRTYSIYLKAGERTKARVQVTDNIESVVCFAVADLSAGTISVTTIGGGTTISNGSATITNAGNGWYRCTVTATFDSTITNPAVWVGLLDAAGSYTYTGDGVSGLYVWGAQWEDATFATSYIPTVASTVTRSADVCGISGTNFSNFYNSQQGTFVSSFDVIWNVPAVQTFGVLGMDTSNSKRIIQIQAGASGVSTRDALTYLGTANLLSSGINKTASAYDLTSKYIVHAGGTVASDIVSSSYANGSTSLNIGAIGTNPIDGHIRSVQYYPTRLPNATLQALTT